MQIHYTSAFKRMFRKLPHLQQEQAERALRIFEDNPFDPRLRNHKLSGSHEDVRSISAGYDLRILYAEQNGHSIIFLLMVGKHDAVY